MAAFNFKLLTPNGVIVNGLECDSLIIPTSRGEVNVLKNHTHFLTELGTGVLTAKTNEGEKHFSVCAGTLKVLKGEVTALSMTSELSADIDVDRAEIAKKKAQAKLAGSDALSRMELIKFRRKLERAEMRIRLGYLRGQ
jgi:F-type H+-transporting ATPase subunit epsilon